MEKVSSDDAEAFMELGNYDSEQARDGIFLRQKLEAFMAKHGYEMAGQMVERSASYADMGRMR